MEKFFKSGKSGILPPQVKEPITFMNAIRLGANFEIKSLLL